MSFRFIPIRSRLGKFRSVSIRLGQFPLPIDSTTTVVSSRIDTFCFVSIRFVSFRSVPIRSNNSFRSVSSPVDSVLFV